MRETVVDFKKRLALVPTSLQTWSKHTQVSPGRPSCWWPREIRNNTCSKCITVWAFQFNCQPGIFWYIKEATDKSKGHYKVLETNLKRQRFETELHLPESIRLSERQGLVCTGDSINFQLFLSLDEKGTQNDVERNHFLRAMYSSISSDAFPQLVKLLKEELTGMERPLLPSTVALVVVQSGFIHGGFVPRLSDCKEVSWGGTVLRYDQKRLEKGPLVRQRVFAIG